MNNPVSKQEVRRLANLSRLTVDENEEELFARQFGEILEHMDKLAAVPTEGVEPLYSPCDLHANTREDIARNIRDREEILSNAPETDGKCFIVPRIV